MTFCVLSDRVFSSQWMNSIHASLMNVWYMHLCTRTARLYIFPPITRFHDPSAMIPVSTHKSRRSAYWKRVPTIDIILQIVWNVPRRSMILAYWSICFQMISAALACKAWSMTTMIYFKYSICRMLIGCFNFFETVNISVAGTFIVGIYPTIYRQMLIDGSDA